jgi:hypothetical protein
MAARDTPVLSPTPRPAPARGGKEVTALGQPSSDPLLTTVFQDSFERTSLGADYRPTSGVWQIQGGRLCGQGAKNHGVWLARRIPDNTRIEFDAMSASEDGDIKAEFWGDGRGAATSVSYTNATSYLTIFGGWKNSFHVLARINEHASNRREIRIEPGTNDFRAAPVRPNLFYHFKVERTDSRTVRWLVDDLEIHALEDPAPLRGAGHDHFGFNNWDVPVCFDNLVVTPLN